MKNRRSKQRPLRCPYCGSVAIIRSADYVHGDNSWGGSLYVCSRFPDCDSYVRADDQNLSPLGTLANGDLRHKRIEAHKLFDQIWKRGVMTRSGAYHWMDAKFGLKSKEGHIGNFSEYMCDALIAECREALRNNKIAC